MNEKKLKIKSTKTPRKYFLVVVMCVTVIILVFMKLSFINNLVILLCSICIAISWVFILCLYIQTVFFALAGLKFPKTVKGHQPIRKFACIIPAHNEETVIGELVSSLKEQRYPKHLYKIFVVADHCTDNTKQIAERNGAEVLERHQTGGGKGAAIRHFLEKLFNEFHEEKFDAVCFFDADNLVSPNFLQKMNDGLCEGKRCIQGYLGTKNPKDNWVTKAIYASYLITNRFYQSSRGKLGFPAACGGTGFCITTDVLKEYGWPAETLTEDLEMQIFYALKGLLFSWIHEAVVYDEKPCSLRIALRQRVRWLIGHLNVLRKYFVKLVVKGVKTKDPKMLDQAFYLLSPLFWMCITFLTFVWGLELIFHIGIFYLGTFEAIILNILMLIIYPGMGIYLETRTKKDVALIPFLLVFALVWVAALILAFKNLNEKKWSHTPHGVIK